MHHHHLLTIFNRTIIFSISTEAFGDNLDQYHPMTQPYLLNFFKSPGMDNVYNRLNDLASSKWILENKVIDFDKRGKAF